MKAALCKEFGGPETLVVEDIAEPQAGQGEVVIKVAAAALNFFDTLAIRGKYQNKPEMPFSPGAEVAGAIDSVGPGVEGLAVGQRVLAYVRFNGCREKTIAEASAVIPVPDSVPDEVAASVTVTYGTTMHALKDRGRLKAGETVAVLGASGGVGLACVEIAKRMGARVIACASSPEKLAVCRDHGADELVDYDKEDLKVRLRELTGGDGVDVVCDNVGGDYAEPAFRATGWEGRYLVIGFAAGAIPKIPLNLPLLKSSEIVGVFWGAWTARNPQMHRANIEQVLQWCASGELAPHIHGVYPLDKIVDALALIDNRKAKGKVVVRPG